MKSAAVVNYAPEKGSVEIREIERPEIGPEDVLLEVFEQILKPRLAVNIENDICEFDVQHVPGENAVARFENTASLKVGDGTIKGFFNVRL